MKKLFYLLILTVLNTVGMNAQSIANYAFSTATPVTLEDMSSGTTELIAGSSVNVASSVTGIGFTFGFMTTSYNDFSVNSNGQMRLGATVISNTGITGAALNTPLIVPMSGSNSMLPTGKVHYKVTGTQPDRVLIVEWKDLIIPYPVSNDNNPPIIDYTVSQIQVLLHESTNVIEFKYGNVGNNSVPTMMRSTFISSSNTANSVKYIAADMVSAVNASAVVEYPMNTTNTNLLLDRRYSFTPPTAPPTVTVVNNCNGTSTLTASNYTGTLLWSTGETSPSITVNLGGEYTVTQNIDGFVSLPASGFAIPVPTITGPEIGGIPATLDGGVTAGQVYTTEPGMDNYVWSVSSAGQITAGQGTNSITVTWTNPTGQQTVSVNYKYVPEGCTPSNPTVLIINYFPFAGPIDPTTVPQFVDPMPHFAAGLRVNAKAGGNLLVKEQMVQQVALSTGTVTSTGTIGNPATPNAGKGNYAAYAISKDNGATFGPAMWPAQTIEAQQGNQLMVQYRNDLVGVKYSDFNILADQTLMMNGYDLTGNPLTDPYTGDIPMVVHLHGGEIPSGSDGGPTAWFTPNYAKLGPGFLHSAQSLVTYPNQQEATTLWYHPHDQGLTRINVYTGLAGYYFLRGQAEETAKLPGWSGDDKVREVTPAGKTPTFNGTNTYLPEIELAVQDRMFNTKGELYWPVAPTNPDIHPFWTPEFFGDIMTVNGKSWPYLSVAPRKYRFRMLDGCNARFLNMWLVNAATSANGPKITVIGTDGGLLDTPVELDPALGKTVTMGPGERLDVVIDFTGIPAGTTFTLMNDANAPFPDGDPVIPGLTDRIMQFVVNGDLVAANDASAPGTDKSLLPSNLRTANPMVKLTNFAGQLSPGVNPLVKRQIILNEVSGAGGPVMVAFNNSHFDTETILPGEPLQFGGPTELPLEGSTEQITIINTTVDAHPIHIHLLQWQLVSRQTFNQPAYMAAYNAAWATRGVPEWPAGLGYPGGAGSPYDYNTLNADGAVGGNPAVSPFLTGLPMLPQPEEMGWKDDVKVLPGEIATFIVRVAPTDRPINAPAADLLFPFDPSIGPGYVWHCHIIDHEDMDMMRPLMIRPSVLRYPQVTTQPQPVVTCIGTTESFSVSATSATTISYQWQKSTDNGATWTDLTNSSPYSGVLTNTLQINPTSLAMSTTKYRVLLTNIDGVTTSDAAMLTVDPFVPASVTISPDRNNVVAGESVTFTPDPVGGGTAPTYEWFKNTVSVSTDATYTYVPVDGDVVYVKMTSNAHCATGSPATSNSVTMNVLPAPTAVTNGDWNTPSTWANNTVPTILDDVIIPIGLTVTINVADAFSKTLYINGTLTSTTGTHTLTVNGALTVNGNLITGNNTVVLKGATLGTGSIVATSGTLVYAATSAQAISNISTNTLKNLTIDNKTGVTLPATLTVSSTLAINAGAKLTNPVGANLTVKDVMINSDLTSGTGTFVDRGSIATIAGGVANVQQYLAGGRNWYVSSPVSNATTSSLSSASVIYSYDEPAALWNTLASGAPLDVTKGYAASISTTGNVTFTGDNLNTGAKNAPLTRLGAIKSGYNLVGNPYPSYLDWRLVYASSSNLEPTMWYRTKNATNRAYVFDTYNAVSEIGTSNNGIQVTAFIPPVQAYWVRVASGNTSGIMAVDNSMRLHENASNNRLKAPGTAASLNQKVLRLKVSNSINSDEAIILFNSMASNGYDVFDSEKMLNDIVSVPEIYTFADAIPLVINGLNNVTPNVDLPLGFTTHEKNIFTINATEISNFDLDTRVVLKDKLLNAEQELILGNTYTFNSDITTTAERFSIVFRSTGVATGLDNVSESIYIFKNKNNQITINRNDIFNEGMVTVWNAVGQKLVSMRTTGTVTVVKERLTPGVYLVTVDVLGKSTIKKIIIN